MFCFVFFICISERSELLPQPILLLHMRIVVQTHCGRLCSTAQRMFWPPCNCDHISSPCRTSLNTSWLPLMLPHVFLFTVPWIMQECSPLWPCVLSFLVLSATAVCVVKFLLERLDLICRLSLVLGGIDASWIILEIYKICLYPEGYLTVKCNIFFNLTHTR